MMMEPRGFRKSCMSIAPRMRLAQFPEKLRVPRVSKGRTSSAQFAAGQHRECGGVLVSPMRPFWYNAGRMNPWRSPRSSWFSPFSGQREPFDYGQKDASTFWAMWVRRLFGSRGRGSAVGLGEGGRPCSMVNVPQGAPPVLGGRLFLEITPGRLTRAFCVAVWSIGCLMSHLLVGLWLCWYVLSNPASPAC